MLTKVDEVFGVDVETLQDVGQVVRDVAFFVFSEKSSIPVDKLQVVSEVKRYTFWHVLSEIADEVEQGFKKHRRRRGNKGGQRVRPMSSWILACGYP